MTLVSMAARRQVESMLAKAKDGKKLVSKVHGILATLQSAHLVRMIRMQLAGLHATVGFLPERVNAIAVDVRQFNATLVANAGGALGHLEPAVLKAATLCGSHTNFVLRICEQQVKHDNAAICSEGRISLEKIRARDELMWQAITEGVLRRIHSLYVQASDPDFQLIKKQALASKPQCAASVPAMYQFLLKASGGKDGTLLAETERFVQQHCQPGRRLGPDLWQVLAQDGRAKLSGHALGRFRHTLVRMQCFRQCCGKDVATKMFSQENASKVLEAEAVMMAELRALTRHVSAQLLDDPRVFVALCLSDIALAAWAIGLRLPNKKKYDSSRTSPEMMRFLTRREEAAQITETAQASSSAAPKAMLMRELREDGSFKNPVAVLQELGYQVGDHVRRKADRTQGVIKDIQKEKVRVEVDGVTCKVFLAAFMSQEWVRVVPKAVAETMAFNEHWPSQNSSFQLQLTSSKIMLELRAQSDKFEGEGWAKLHAQVKPNKSLACAGKFQKHELTLIPVTGKIGSHAGFKEIPASSFNVQTSWGDDATEESEQGFMAPFWFAQLTHNSELANLQLHWLRADSGIKIPCFRNGKALKEGDRLMYFKEKRKAEVALLEQSPGKTKVHAPAKRCRTADAAE
ncbi:unnamed protein product [Effrenium voratum]|nr:unnamed protein product [Effrenium voratum]